MRKMTYGDFLMQQRATEQRIAKENEKQRYQSEIVPWSVECSAPGLSIKDAGKATRAEAVRRIQTTFNVFSTMTTSKLTVGRDPE